MVVSLALFPQLRCKDCTRNSCSLRKPWHPSWMGVCLCMVSHLHFHFQKINRVRLYPAMMVVKWRTFLGNELFKLKCVRKASSCQQFYLVDSIAIQFGLQMWYESWDHFHICSSGAQFPYSTYTLPSFAQLCYYQPACLHHQHLCAPNAFQTCIQVHPTSAFHNTNTSLQSSPTYECGKTS